MSNNFVTLDAGCNWLLVPTGLLPIADAVKHFENGEIGKGILLCIPIINIIADIILRALNTDAQAQTSRSLTGRALPLTPSDPPPPYQITDPNPIRTAVTEYEKRRTWLNLYASQRNPESVQAIKAAAFQTALKGTLAAARANNALDLRTIMHGLFDGVLTNLFFPDMQGFFFTDNEIEEILGMIRQVVSAGPQLPTQGARPQLPCNAHQFLTDQDIGFLRGLTADHSACLIARLEETLITHKKTEQYQNILSKVRFQRHPTPGDGNCFLWACLQAVSLLERKPINRSTMEALRQNMVQTFQANIRRDPEFRVEFVNYIYEHPREFQDLLPTINPDDAQHVFVADQEEALSAERQRLCVNKEAPDNMVNGYAEKLSQNGTWNGEFEAGIAAQCLKRPIVMFKAGKFEVIAGATFFNQGAAPIFIEHVGGCHWITLHPLHPQAHQALQA